MDITLANNQVYVTTGREAFNPDKPNIVFIHGAGLDHTTWVLFNRFFARNGFNSIAFDLPGHGKTEGSAVASIEEMASWVIRFLDAANITTTAIVGHSMGSLVALETASLSPDRFDSVVLLGTGVPMVVGEELLDAARNNDHAAIDMIMLFAHAYSSQLGGNRVAGINIVNANMRLLERSLNGVLYNDLNACNEYNNGLKAAGKINKPVTLILGKEDQMTPTGTAKDLIDSLTDPEVVMLSGCGHMMLSEDPEAVHKSLVKALHF